MKNNRSKNSSQRRKSIRKSKSPRKSQRNTKGDKEQYEKQITSCDYGLYPVNYPMNVDDYEFVVQKGFLNNLVKLYDGIKKNGDKFQIENVHEMSPKLFMRDILTEYTVKNIFKINSQTKLIHIINKIMKSLYSQFYDVTGIKLFFIYRGGNILKMYKNSFENILPGKARKIVKDEFEDYFKNSDIDFYTVIDKYEKLSNSELLGVNNYIQMMCYYGIYIARIFVMNNFNLFEFCRFNTIALQEDFQGLLGQMNEDKMDSEFKEIRDSKFIGLGFNQFMYMKKGYDIHKILELPSQKIVDEFIDNVDDISVFENYKKFKKSGRYDINITPSDDFTDLNTISYKQKNLFTENFTKDMNDLVKMNKIFDYYITNNNKIYNKGESIDFSLVRLMINYVVVYERNGKYGFTNASSELFDLSIGHPKDKMYTVYTSDAIVPYQFEYEDGKQDEIYIPAIETTIVDLIKILFEYKEFPWEDPKYVKRLYRLLILVFVNQFSMNSLTQMEKILKSNKMRKYKDSHDTTFETLLYRNNELKMKLPLKYKKEFEEYLERYEQIIKKLIHIIQKLKIFDVDEKKIKKKDIYAFIKS
jgi:hypothetical protein